MLSVHDLLFKTSLCGAFVAYTGIVMKLTFVLKDQYWTCCIDDGGHDFYKKIQKKKKKIGMIIIIL